MRKRKITVKNQFRVFQAGSHRQRKILEFLALKPYSRDAISKLLRDSYPVSKTTLYRDLVTLQDANLIKAKGVGKKTKYYSLENPLTRYIDLRDYFKESSALRLDAKEAFNFDVFTHLFSIISDQETIKLKKHLNKLSDQEKKLDPTIFKREIERFTVEFSWKSSRIEGNTYTLLETELLIKRMREAADHPKYEATMILNHKYAIDYILTHRTTFKNLTINKLLVIHNILIKDLGITEGIRNNEVAITGTNYVPLRDSNAINKTLKKTIEAINTTEFPVSKALIASSMIAYIQPFNDGNKRTARTLANAILLAYDLYPVSYRDVDDLYYIEAMILFYEQNNLYHLKRILLEQVQFSVENYFRT